VLATNDRRQPSTRPVRHDGPCGSARIPCPVHGLALGPLYPPAERLPNGTVVAHDCGRSWRPWELVA
jgi:hypothetical protein